MTLTICTLCNDNIEPQRTPSGEVFWTEGHNAQPLDDGRCCDTCNSIKVIPARIASRMKNSALSVTTTDFATGKILE